MLKQAHLKVGEFVSSTTYMKVLEVKKNEIYVEDMQNGMQFFIEGVKLIENLDSAAQYTETKKCSKHELVSALQNAKDKVFTVSFTKQNGEVRILTGHLISFDGMLGRTQVRDLEAEDKTKNIKLIDNRTIAWLVLNNVKHVAQK